MTRKIFLEKDHPVRADFIDPDALWIIQKLQEAGFLAYIVGGGVRDLLFNERPKDFDITTNAKPEEIKGLFRKACILIGRRFRLAHIRFGAKVIEVSTFRSGSTDDDSLIVRDNSFGTEEEDALRRDFTINALFYDPTHHVIIDYVQGLKDIEHRLLRVIGDPEKRFRQDPVRMIRLLKFVARFDLKIESETQKAMDSQRYEIMKSSPDRVQGEIFKMLETKSTEKFFRLFQESGFMSIYFPYISSFLDSPDGEKSYLLLRELDRHPSSFGDKTLGFACLVFPMLEKMVAHQFPSGSNAPHLGEIFPLTAELIQEAIVNAFPRFPRWMRESLAFILNTQWRFTPYDPKVKVRINRISKHPDYKWAKRFLVLRSVLEEQSRQVLQEIQEDPV